MIGEIILLAIVVSLAIFIYKVTKNDRNEGGGEMSAV